jgi:hypothetical protein
MLYKYYSLGKRYQMGSILLTNNMIKSILAIKNFIIISLFFLTLILLPSQIVSAVTPFNVDSGGKFEIKNSSMQLTISVGWTNESNNVKLRLTTPSSKIIQEDDFVKDNDQSANLNSNSLNLITIVKDLSNSKARSVLLINPESGVWKIEIVDASGLGDLIYSGTDLKSAPKLKIEIPVPASDTIYKTGSIEYSISNSGGIESLGIEFSKTNDEKNTSGLFPSKKPLTEVQKKSEYFGATYEIDAAALTPGQYYVRGLLYDNKDEIISKSAYSKGKIIIVGNNPPEQNSTQKTTSTQAINSSPAIQQKSQSIPAKNTASSLVNESKETPRSGGSNYLNDFFQILVIVLLAILKINYLDKKENLGKTWKKI